MILNRMTVLVSFIFLSVLIYTGESTNNNLAYTVKLKKIECIINPVMVTNYTCKLKPQNWHRSIVNVESYLMKPVSNVTLRIELFKYTNQYRPFLINVTVNICKWFDRKSGQNAYARIALNMITRFTNVNHSCPYMGLIKVEGLYFEPKFALFAVPTGTFMFVFTFFEGFPYIHLGTLKCVGEVNDKEDFTRRSVRHKLYSKAED